jgi:hypothetical protein
LKSPSLNHTYEGHSKNTWTFVITNLFDVILLPNLVDIFWL